MNVISPLTDFSNKMKPKTYPNDQSKITATNDMTHDYHESALFTLKKPVDKIHKHSLVILGKKSKKIQKKTKKHKMIKKTKKHKKIKKKIKKIKKDKKKQIKNNKRSKKKIKD